MEDYSSLPACIRQAEGIAWEDKETISLGLRALDSSGRELMRNLCLFRQGCASTYFSLMDSNDPRAIEARALLASQ